MGMRDTVNGAIEVTRLTFDAVAAVVSMVVAIPVAFAIGEATTMARAARGDITPTTTDGTISRRTRLSSTPHLAPLPLDHRDDAYLGS
ncbi:hypothetical protein [Rhodococcus tibetensis]|uniref:Uncharacterized protein n=1 Tax=Rhodococcus tibetensis TaxID=2965064 RepID=A0ABT1QHU6_9NOCA|nr:hypothetical protein [Rhodococcus sp. FXJ9.536]MCQ4121861.1 hypothetical protein [Rhodococcus sp. FXJ9.536]